MEYLNRIELTGHVGEVNVREVGKDCERVAHFQMCTCYKWWHKYEKHWVIETEWHNVTAWEGQKGIDFKAIEKGKAIHVVGRLKMNRYVDGDNVEHVSYEVRASKVEEVKDEQD